MVDIQNTIEKLDALFFKKVPYQVYLVGCFIMLFVVAGFIYEYNNQEQQLNLTVDLGAYVPVDKAESIMIKVQEGCEGAWNCYQPKEFDYVNIDCLVKTSDGYDLSEECK